MINCQIKRKPRAGIKLEMSIHRLKLIYPFFLPPTSYRRKSSPVDQIDYISRRFPRVLTSQDARQIQGLFGLVDIIRGF